MDVIAIAWASTYEKTAGAARGWLQSGATRWLLDEDDSIFAAFGVGYQPTGVLAVNGVEVARWWGAAGEQALREAFEMVTAWLCPCISTPVVGAPAELAHLPGSDILSGEYSFQRPAEGQRVALAERLAHYHAVLDEDRLRYSDADAWPDNVRQASISLNAGQPGAPLWSGSRTVFSATASIDNHSLVLDIDDPGRLALHGVPYAAEDEDPVRGSCSAPVYDMSTMVQSRERSSTPRRTAATNPASSPAASHRAAPCLLR